MLCDTYGVTSTDASASAAPAPAPAPTTMRFWRNLLRLLGAIALVAAAAYAGHRLTLQAGLARLQEEAVHRLDMLTTGLDADLARFEYLPALLEMTPAVPALLETPSDRTLRDTVNRYLSGVNATAGAEMLYVLDAGGVSLAASDWDQPGTTIGQDLSFRPYVVQAMERGRGSFYGVGITSRRPGYYLSYALRRSERSRGLVAVKVNIERAEQAWRNAPGDALLVDERGVVILSTREDLKYRPLEPLNATQRAEVQRSRPYGEGALLPLPWTVQNALSPSAQLIKLDRATYLASSRALQRAPWRLIALDDPEPARVVARYAAVTAASAMAVLLLAGLTWRERRRAIRQKLANQAALQAAHDSLESTVVARTAQLRAAQSELIHTGKLAALGQMSAGMVHELNQPLTALRTLSDSAAILLDQDRRDDVRANLRRIAGTVDRLGRLTSRLKTFAHKSDAPLAPVLLARSVAAAQAGVGAELKACGIGLEVDIEPVTLSVLAEESAVGSVIINLMRNAIDAMNDTPHPLLAIRARAQGERAIITVSDNGSGIRPDILARLFEPFVTSKPAGVGLGLGLVISAQLVGAIGGTLGAANLENGGACFTIHLPIAPTHE
jgi:two-component system C4-dicarboxylate transport sensor histidine kinase DctB